MIHRIVQAALRQRFLVLMLTAFITVGGILSFERMPVDAYPDLSPPQVEIITQWPDHASEEVERLVTLPLELEMNGVPHMVVMRYQVRLDPARIYGYHLTIPQVVTALSANNANAGGGFYSQGGQFYYVRGIGLVRNTDDIGNIVVGANKGVPIRIRDIGEVTIGHAPRLGEFGFQKNDDSVEGVILMLRGEQTQNVLKAVAAKTEELNRQILPPDVKH